MSRRLPRRARLSAAAVTLVTAAALALGWQVRASVVESSREVRLRGLTAEIPSGWLVQEGVGDLAFAARSPARELPVISVSGITEQGGIEERVAARTAARQRALASYQAGQIEPSPSMEGADYEVRFTYADVPNGGTAKLVEGIDVYTSVDGRTVVVSLEAEAGRLAEAIPALARLVGSLSASTEGGSR